MKTFSMHFHFLEHTLVCNDKALFVHSTLNGVKLGVLYNRTDTETQVFAFRLNHNEGLM